MHPRIRGNLKGHGRILGVRGGPQGQRRILGVKGGFLKSGKDLWIQGKMLRPGQKNPWGEVGIPRFRGGLLGIGKNA